MDWIKIMDWFEVICSFFSSNIWNIIGNILMIIGIIAPVFTIPRFIHNNKIKKWVGNVSIKENDYEYYDRKAEFDFKDMKYSSINDETEYASTFIFKPKNDIIPKLKVFTVNGKGRNDKCIEQYNNLTPEQAVCFRTDLPEGIPKYRLRWYNNYGDYAEWEFGYNGRNGIHDIDGTIYKTTLFSFFRKAIGWQ